MKKLILLLPILLALTGCKNPALTQAVVRTTVGSTVGYSLIKKPELVPYVRLSTDVICATAHSTNISPAAIVKNLELIDPSVKTPEGILLVNGALSLYRGVWESYGSNAVNNATALRPFLMGTCEGLTDAVSLSTVVSSARTGATKAAPVGVVPLPGK